MICNSNMVKEEVRRHFGLAGDKLHVIYNGVDLTAFNPRLRAEWRARKRSELGISNSAIVFLFVGSGFARKGVPQLLRAMTGVRGAQLVVVGEDRELALMRRAVGDMKLAERVHFAGAQKDVQPWYGMADCFVLPTLYDPFPNAALEAMACGLPLITSLQCGAPSSSKAASRATSAAMRSTWSSSRACLNLAAAPGPGSEDGRGGAAQSGPYGLEAMALQLTELYARLIEAK